MKNLPKIVLAFVIVASLYACNKREEKDAMNISSSRYRDSLNVDSLSDSTWYNNPYDTIYHNDPYDTIYHNNPYDTTWNSNPIDTVWYYNPIDSGYYNNPIDSNWTPYDSSAMYRHN